MKLTFLSGWLDRRLSKRLGTDMTLLEMAIVDLLKDREYGKGVKGIKCIVNCFEHDEDDPNYNEECNFNKRTKNIECTIDLRYDVVRNFEKRREFVNYMQNKHLANVNEMMELAIADFDSYALMKDFQSLFEVYLLQHNKLEDPIWDYTQ